MGVRVWGLGCGGWGVGVRVWGCVPCTSRHAGGRMCCRSNTTFGGPCPGCLRVECLQVESGEITPVILRGTVSRFCQIEAKFLILKIWIFCQIELSAWSSGQSSGCLVEGGGPTKRGYLTPN